MQIPDVPRAGDVSVPVPAVRGAYSLGYVDFCK